MTWLQRHRIQLYLRNSLWISPTLGIVLGWVVVASLTRFERSMGWELPIAKENALAVMSTVAASMFSLVVVVCSALLLAVQLASAQLTPRIIVLIFRNTARKVLLAIFAFTFTFSVSFLVRIGTAVPLLTAYIAAYGFLLNLTLFLYFIDNIGKSLRPSSALRTVALGGREVIQTVYPRMLDKKEPSEPQSISLLDGEPTRTVVNSSDGVVLAFDLKGLVAMAERSNCVIEMMPQVGDFVAKGEPLFQIFEGGNDLSDHALCNLVALGPERTFEQDPMFAFRIMVDIASKALSPAINDPTTAVLAIDQIHHLLHDLGLRNLAEGLEMDKAGRLRLAYRTPNWEDFVSLAVTEIRQYGNTSIQVTRRLLAMLESLIASLPESRIPALSQEADLLRSTVERSFVDPGDRLRASISDLQGVGGRLDQSRKPAHQPANALTQIDSSVTR